MCFGPCYALTGKKDPRTLSLSLPLGKSKSVERLRHAAALTV